MVTASSHVTRRAAAVWITAAVCTYPVGVPLSVYVLSQWPSLQDDFICLGAITWPFVAITCIGWIVAARMEYWPDFPMWRLLSWLLLCIVGALTL